MKKNSNLLIYFLSRSLFLGGGISTLFLYCSKDAYIAIILGTLLGIGIIYIISRIKISKPFNIYLQEKSFINILIKFIFICYIIFGIFILLIILATFLYSYFLPFTPSVISCLPFIFLAAFLSPKSTSKIVYVAQVLFIISLILIFLKTILLANEFDFGNLLPVLTTKPFNIFKASLIFTILSTAPFILLIDESIQFKQSLKYYLISSLTIFIVVLTITAVLGELVNVYSYPEYSVLRKIRLFKFIENIENFISIGWFFDIFICLSLSSLKLKQLFNTNKSIVSFGITTFILFIVNCLIINNFYNSIIIYKIFPIILAIFMFILFLLFAFKKRIDKND